MPGGAAREIRIGKLGVLPAAHSRTDARVQQDRWPPETQVVPRACRSRRELRTTAAAFENRFSELRQNRIQDRSMLPLTTAPETEVLWHPGARRTVLRHVSLPGTQAHSQSFCEIVLLESVLFIFRGGLGSVGPRKLNALSSR